MNSFRFSNLQWNTMDPTKRPSFRRSLSCFPLFCLLLCLPACGDQPGEDVHIGVICQTAVPGEMNMVDALNLIAKQVNAEGGLDVAGKKHSIVLQVEDSKGTPEGALDATRKLISQKTIAAIIGPNMSSLAIPVAQYVEKAQVPMISPLSTNPETTSGKRFVFRAAYIDPFQGQVMARFAREEFKARRGAVLFDTADTYCRGIADIFKQSFETGGGTIVAYESYTSDMTDFLPAMSRIHDSQPDVLFLPSFASTTLIPQAKLARKLGLSIPIIGSDSWGPEELRSLPEFEGTYFSHHWAPENSNPPSLQFVDAYRKSFGRNPEPGGALAADALGLILAAIRQEGKTDAASIQHGLYALAPYAGITGVIDYTDSGDPIKSAVIIKISKGQALFYRQVDPQ